MGKGVIRLLLALAGVASAQSAQAAITLRCTPDQPVAAGGALVTVDCSLESTEDVEIGAVQLDFRCALPGTGVSGTVIRESLSVDQDHQDPPFLFATKDGAPLTSIRFEYCRVSAAPGAGEPPVLLPANEPRYVASIAYRVSDCARGSFQVLLENFSNPPTDADLTRVLDSLRQPLAFTLDPNPPMIGAPNGCMCSTHPECNDDNPCTSDSCSSFLCRNQPLPVSCDDGQFCTSDDRCSSGLCVGSDQPGTCEGFLVCDEVNDTCLECRLDNECAASTVCKVARCSAGVCFELDRVGPCDDGLFCTLDDACDAGQCVGVGTPCGEDETCHEETQSCIPSGCPDTSIFGSDPPSFVVDARQPHPPDASDLPRRTGIGGQGEPVFLELGTGGAGPDCFFLDETEVEPGMNANVIASVVEVEPRLFRLFLARPITTGAITYLSYNDGSSAAFISHPSTVNADGVADAADVVSLADYLLGLADPPFGVYSLDLNHSDAPDLADLMAAVNLLNGADLYASWNGTVMPE